MSMEMMPAYAGAEDIPFEQEPSPEAEAIMEVARNERAGILSRVMNRKTLEAGLLLAPGLDVATLATFVARGETMTGKELDGRERLNYAAIAGFLTLFYTLQAAGMTHEALAAKGVALTLGAVEYGPDALEKVKGMAQEKMPAIAEFMGRTGEFLKNKQAQVENVQRSIVNFATSNPDLTLLNLHG